LVSAGPAARAGWPRATQSPRPDLRNAGTNSARLPVFKAALFEEYLRLKNCEDLTGNGAARAVGLSVSAVSGQGSQLSRYLRLGLVGLERHGGGDAGCELSKRIEALGWFIPAAQFFFLSPERRYRAMATAIHRTIALPSLPRGWRRDTRARFLWYLGMETVPLCPADLREELLSRERQRKGIVPEWVVRQILSFPSRVRRYQFEALAEELSQIPLTTIMSRIAYPKPEARCRVTLELL
jgi:hypothetical protein